MKRQLLLLFMFFCLVGNAQKVKVIKMSRDYFRHTHVGGFDYLHVNADTSTFQWVANVRVEFDTIQLRTLKGFYNKFNSKANKMGANAFRVLNAELYTYREVKYIELSVFHLRRENRDENLELFQAGKIYLFGFLGHHQRIGGYKIEVNGKKMLLQELRYKIYEPEIGKELRVKLGRGLKSDKIKTVIEPQMLPRYYKFDLYKGMLSRGIISEHEWSFGEFLVHLLKKERETL